MHKMEENDLLPKFLWFLRYINQPLFDLMKDTREVGFIPDLIQQHLLAKYAPSGRHIVGPQNMVLFWLSIKQMSRCTNLPTISWGLLLCLQRLDWTVAIKPDLWKWVSVYVCCMHVIDQFFTRCKPPTIDSGKTLQGLLCIWSYWYST